MLLVVDVGNTQTVIGIFREKMRLADWRLATDRYRTADEWGQLVCNLLHIKQLECEGVSGVVISCVVPPLESVLERMCLRYFNIKPLWVSGDAVPDLPIRYDNPREVGADRIVNARMARERYGPPCIIIDFGTATTFDIVGREGEYLGGVICPGIGISSNALFEKAARLPRVDLVKPASVIGRDTVHSMQAGLYFGYLELVRGIVRRIREEMGEDSRVVLTGGLSRVFADEMSSEAIVDPYLTLDGLRSIYARSLR